MALTKRRFNEISDRVVGRNYGPIALILRVSKPDLASYAEEIVTQIFNKLERRVGNNSRFECSPFAYDISFNPKQVCHNWFLKFLMLKKPFTRPMFTAKCNVRFTKLQPRKLE
jgi:hypothetical protein